MGLEQNAINARALSHFQTMVRRGRSGMSEAETEEFYEMANLYPKHTGLPMVIWVSERGHAQHDVRVKVSTKHGDRMNIHDTAVVGVRPASVLAGVLRPADRQAVFQWITLNEKALVDYWNRVIDTVDLVQGLKSLPNP
jgi:hypothetical protein